MKNFLKKLVSFIYKEYINSQSSDEALDIDLEKRDKNLKERIDAANKYSIEFEKSLLNLQILICTGAFACVKYYNIKNNILYIFCATIFISIILSMLAMFFSKRQMQQHIDLEQKYLNWVREKYVPTDKENKKDIKEREAIKKSGEYYYFCFYGNLIFFSVSAILFFIYFIIIL